AIRGFNRLESDSHAGFHHRPRLGPVNFALAPDPSQLLVRLFDYSGRGQAFVSADRRGVPAARDWPYVDRQPPVQPCAQVHRSLATPVLRGFDFRGNERKPAPTIRTPPPSWLLECQVT